MHSMRTSLQGTLRSSLRLSSIARSRMPTQAQWSAAVNRAVALDGTAANTVTAAARTATSAVAAPGAWRGLHTMSRPLVRSMAPVVSSTTGRVGFHVSGARNNYFGQRRFLAYMRQSLNTLLRRAEAEANAKPYDSRAQAEYLSLLNDAGLHGEVLRRGHSGKFAAGGKVYAEMQRAQSMVHGDGATSSYGGGGYAPPPPSMGAQASASMKGQSAEEPLHVMVSARTSPFTMFGRVVSIGFTIFLCALLFQSMKGGSGGIRGPLDSLTGGFSEDNKEIPDTKFADVKGVDEAKEELEHIVDYLKHPDKYTKLGGKIPRGVLLTGPPGTGKTLLARAIAGEAEVPFFSRSASEFEEMLVGLGASRVRKLFEAARENAPCIVFIDEIDAIGGKRMKVSTVGHDRQTLNQLLSSMDGFVKSEGVIVLAATNFPESLDAALTRPGRFDVSVTVPIPDVKGRKEILELYLSKVQADESIDPETLARATPGMSGADLETLVNGAALRAAKRNSPFVTIEDIDEAKDKLMLGPARRNKVVRPETLKKTAYHEGGHTLVAMLTKHSMPIYKTTVLPRGQTAGVTYFLPEYKDEGNLTRAQIMAQLDVAMGGRVAEEIIYGADEVTTGAGSDMQKATQLARQFVTQFSMSNLGLTTYDRNMPPSPETQATIDKEVKRLLDESYARASKLLTQHRTELDRLANALVKHETLTLEEMKVAILGRSLPTEEQKQAERAASHKKKLEHKKPRSGGGWFDWGSGSSSKQPKKEAAATPKPSANPPIPILKPHVPAAPAPPRKTEGPDGKKEGGGRQWV